MTDHGTPHPKLAPVGDSPGKWRRLPDPERVCGECPQCGEPLVKHEVTIPGEGQVRLHECWSLDCSYTTLPDDGDK